mmetsp:Transcript_80791/g.254928  ORF Transcript_80791/g.254928 Transcript_80791/m.254928 type:complete len:532 (-) Transcript_80791:377-1972(-)
MQGTPHLTCRYCNVEKSQPGKWAGVKTKTHRSATSLSGLDRHRWRRRASSPSPPAERAPASVLLVAVRIVREFEVLLQGLLRTKALRAVWALHPAIHLQAHVAHAAVAGHRLPADLDAGGWGRRLLRGRRPALRGLGAQEACLVVVRLAVQGLLLQRQGCKGGRVGPLEALLPAGARELAVGGEVEAVLVPGVLQVRLHAGRMLEPDGVGAGHVVHLHAEPRVVHHAHEVPGGPLRLAVLGVVPAAHRKLEAVAQVPHRDVHRPVHPAVHHAELVGPLEALDLGRTPGVAVVERHLEAVDGAAGSVVGVAAHLVRGLREGDLLAVRGRPDRGVHVAVVDGVGRVLPDLVLRRLVLGGDVLGEHAVVEDVVVALALLLRDADLREPLDHPAADVAGDEQAHRIAVVGVQQLPVHHEGQHDGAGRVHHGPARVGGAIGGVALRHLTRRALEVDPVGALLLALDADVLHQRPQRHARPDRGRGRRAARVEADALLDQVLLLAAVPRARQRHGHADRGQADQLIHAEGHRAVHEA